MAWRGVIDNAKQSVPEFTGQPQGFLAGSHPGWHGDAGGGLRTRRTSTGANDRAGGRGSDRRARGSKADNGARRDCQTREPMSRS